tara:strand:+ start:57112 stop:57627 length:516 start_codon:yes stop_codon:yes gene_type:complete
VSRATAESGYDPNKILDFEKVILTPSLGFKMTKRGLHKHHLRDVTAITGENEKRRCNCSALNSSALEDRQYMHVLSAKRLHPVRQAGNFPRYRVRVKDAAADATHHFGLGFFQGCRSGGLIASVQCHFDLLHEGTNTGAARNIHIGATTVCADALLRRLMIGHVFILYQRS